MGRRGAKDTTWGRWLAILAAVLLVLGLAACNREPEAEAAPNLPAEGPGGFMDELEAGGGGERTENPEELQALWEAYIYPVFTSISNYTRGFESLEDIPMRDLCDYLRGRMFWHYDTEGMDKDEYTPVEKLETYCERYFGGTVDFRQNREDLWYYYDAQTDRASSGNLRMDRDEPGRYDDLQAFPQCALDAVAYYPDGWVIATCTSYANTDIEADRYSLNKRFLMREREDGSLYFVACDYAFDATDRIRLSGDYQELTMPVMDMDIIMPGPAADSFVAGWRNKDNSQVYGTLDMYTGVAEEGITLAADGSDAARIRHAGLTGDTYVVMTGEKLLAFKGDLGVVLSWDAHPTWLMDAVDDADRLANVCFSPDLARVSVCAAEGVRVFEVATGESMLVPDTARKWDDRDIMSGEAYSGGDFVAGGSKLFCMKVGYEWTVGYLLYDLGTGESLYYPYSSGYGRTSRLTDGGYFLANYDVGLEEGEPIYIDFETGEVFPVPAFASQDMEMSGIYVSTPGHYRVELYPVGVPGGHNESIVSYHVRVLDTATGQTRDTGCVLEAPGSAYMKVAATSDGRAYVQATYLGEHVAFVAG